jgi:hypothetical protein
VLDPPLDLGHNLRRPASSSSTRTAAAPVCASVRRKGGAAKPTISKETKLLRHCLRPFGAARCRWRARTKAAERDTSLSALIKRFLVELVSEESAERGLERQERDLRAQIRDFSAGDRLSREDVHGRRE